LFQLFLSHLFSQTVPHCLPHSLLRPEISWSGRKQPSFQSLLNLLISHNRSKRGFFPNRYIPINSCCFSVNWSINWCKWCRSFYPCSRNATYSLDTLLYSLLKYESRPSNSDSGLFHELSMSSTTFYNLVITSLISFLVSWLRKKA